MKNILATLLLLIISFNTYAQTNKDADIEGLIALEQYQTIVENYANKDIDTYSAKSLYNIGFSYYMLEDDDNCLKYMDLAIDKDPSFPAPYFIKASTYNYINRLEEDAIPYFLKAINLETDKEKLAQSYISLGYSYYALGKYDLAIETYQEAIDNTTDKAMPYVMIGQIYAETNRQDKALEAFYLGKNNISQEAKEYINILFNIALLEQLQGNNNKAEVVYKELLEINPTDYHTYARLIQIYNHNKEYDKVTPLKEVLYSAHKDGLIQDENLLDMFCIDQFTHKGKQIQVFERYQEGDSKRIYNKILFYILKDDGELDFRIQTEYSPVAVAFGEAKYILCANKDNVHLNYGIGFTDDSSYEEIKNTVIKILDK